MRLEICGARHERINTFDPTKPDFGGTTLMLCTQPKDHKPANYHSNVHFDEVWITDDG